MLLARWLGIEIATPPSQAADLVGRLDLSAVPREPIVWDLDSAALPIHR
jgi:hypothetical protein